MNDIAEKDLDILPLERAETIPSRWYTDPAFYAIDIDSVFNTTWQYVGHASRVISPGAHIIGTAGNNPVIIVRGSDGALRAFFNVCRHRAGPLATADGCTKMLQCQYHGWTYMLDGQLRGVPKFDRTELFDRKDYGLIPLRLEEWEGLLFVSLATDPPPVATLLEGITERISPLSIRSLRFYRRIKYTVECNWKVYMDNYLEGYHVPIVHPELNKLLTPQEYITETFGTYSLQHSPIAKGGTVYGSGRAFYYCVFPNFMMNIFPGRLQTNCVIPVASDRCHVIFDYYYDDVSSIEGQNRAEEDIRYADSVQEEDREICEHVQRGLASIAYDRGRFSAEMENAVYHFQCLLKDAHRRYLSRKR